MHVVYVYRIICMLYDGSNKSMLYMFIGSFVCYMMVVTSACCIRL